MKCVDLIAIPVSDPQRSKAFYLMVGFQLLDEQPMGNGRQWIQLGFPGCSCTLALVTWFSEMKPGGVHGLVFLTDTIAEDVQSLDKNGIPHSGLKDAGEGRFVSFKDPDGNSMSFKEVRRAPEKRRFPHN